MKTWGIYRLPGVQAERRRQEVARVYAISYRPRPKRVGVVEAATVADALEAFALAEEARSSHVTAWRIGRGHLTVTITNGVNVHEALYEAWRQ